MAVIDATNAIAGRLAAFAAKTALRGETVDVVNAEKAVISGDATAIIARYRVKRGLQNKADPDHSPKYPRRPDQFLKRMIRSMLPPHTKRGAEAEKRIRTHYGVPREFEGKGKPFPSTTAQLKNRFVSIEDVCKALGWSRAA